MRTRLLPALSALAALAALALVPMAAAAPPLPFGHVCAPREGALSCPTAVDAPPNGTSGVDVSRLRLMLPARERRPR